MKTIANPKFSPKPGTPQMTGLYLVIPRPLLLGQTGPVGFQLVLNLQHHLLTYSHNRNTCYISIYLCSEGSKSKKQDRPDRYWLVRRAVVGSQEQVNKKEEQAQPFSEPLDLGFCGVWSTILPVSSSRSAGDRYLCNAIGFSLFKEHFLKCFKSCLGLKSDP